MWRPAEVDFPNTLNWWAGVLFLFALWDFLLNGVINPLIGALLLGPLLGLILNLLLPEIQNQNKLRIAVLPLAILFTMAVIFEDREVLRVVWLLSAAIWWGVIVLPLVFRGRIELTSNSLITKSLGLTREISYHDIDAVERPILPDRGARLALRLKAPGGTVRLCVSEEDAPTLAAELESRIRTSHFHC